MPSYVHMAIHVEAIWDSDARVWVANSTDVPGLITEAPGLDALKTKLDVLIPELLAESCRATGNLSPHFRL